jgi:hypothetical protein
MRVEDADEFCLRVRHAANDPSARLLRDTTCARRELTQGLERALGLHARDRLHLRYLRDSLLDRCFCLANDPRRDPKQPTVRLLDRLLCRLAAQTKGLSDLAHAVRDRATHVAQLEGELHPGVDETTHRAPKNADAVFAQGAVGRVVDGRLDHRRVDTHLAARGDMAVARLLDDSIEDLVEARLRAEAARGAPSSWSQAPYRCGSGRSAGTPHCRAPPIQAARSSSP